MHIPAGLAPPQDEILCTWPITDYVAKSRLWLRYVKLMQHPAGGAEFQSFIAELRARGIRRLQGDQELEAWAESYKAGKAKGLGLP